MIKVIVTDQELCDHTNEISASIYLRQKLRSAGIPIGPLGIFVHTGKLEKEYDQKSCHTIYRYTSEKESKE